MSKSVVNKEKCIIRSHHVIRIESAGIWCDGIISDSHNHDFVIEMGWKIEIGHSFDVIIGEIWPGKTARNRQFKVSSDNRLI